LLGKDIYRCFKGRPDFIGVCTTYLRSKTLVKMILLSVFFFYLLYLTYAVHVTRIQILKMIDDAEMNGKEISLQRLRDLVTIL